MALTSNADLLAYIADKLARDDLTSQIPDFIKLFEAAAARRLGSHEQEDTATLTITAGAAALPADFAAIRRLTWTGSTRAELDYVAPSWLQANYTTTASGIPLHYTLEESNILVRPIDDSAGLELLYRARTGALASALNWLMTKHPDAYVFGALAEAAGFIDDFSKAAFWKARRDEALNEIEVYEIRARGSMAIRTMGPTP